MTFTTAKNITDFRYHIYVKDELIAVSKTMLLVRGFLQVFLQEEEYVGIPVEVHDTYLPGEPKVIQKKGGEDASSADIIPFVRK